MIRSNRPLEFLRAFTIALSICVCGCQLVDSIKDTQEELRWPDNFAFSDTPGSKITGKTWTVAWREEASGKSAKLTFVRWYQRLKPSEAHEVVIYEDVPATGMPPKKIYAQVQAATAKDCPGAQYTLIKDESPELWFELKAPQCGETAAHDEINRYIFGIWDLFRIDYRVYASAMNPDERAEAMKVLSSFELIHG